ncbi:MAG: class I SAM-dependent methyltransferase [Marinifilaceae bacterium]
MVDQYKCEFIYEEIVKAITAKRIDQEDITIKEVSAFDEFHVRGRQVSQEIFEDVPLREDSYVLDIGCGLGGTGRMLAHKLSANVKGIDITPEYIRTASLLSELTGLQDKTDFIQADALNLPFVSDSFDLVISQHTQMNIEDKEKLYSEIFRVLKPAGSFVYYDVFKSEGNETYPLPWANEEKDSFLISCDEMSALLENTGFSEIAVREQSTKAIKFLSVFLEKAETNKSMLIGQKILMGSNTEHKLRNIFEGLKEFKLVLQSGVYKKIL